jgi:hypothetical protein
MGVRTSHYFAPDVQFPQAMLGGNLPRAGYADQELVNLVRNKVSYSGG